MYVFLFQILLHERLLQDIEYSSLCLITYFTGSSVYILIPKSEFMSFLIPALLFGNHKFVFYESISGL